MSLSPDFAYLAPYLEPKVPVAHSIEQAKTEVNRFTPSNPRKQITSKELRKLGVPSEYMDVFATLTTPEKAQHWFNSEIKYNHGESNRAAVGVIKHKEAHCFEGAVMLHTLLSIWGWNPQIVMIWADVHNFNEVHHNVVCYRVGDKIGCVGMSGYEHLKTRDPIFGSTRDLIWDMYRYFYCEDKTSEKYGTPTIRGYSDPIDLQPRWNMRNLIRDNGPEALNDVYEHYSDKIMITSIYDPRVRFEFPND